MYYYDVDRSSKEDSSNIILLHGCANVEQGTTSILDGNKTLFRVIAS